MCWFHIIARFHIKKIPWLLEPVNGSFVLHAQELAHAHHNKPTNQPAKRPRYQRKKSSEQSMRRGWKELNKGKFTAQNVFP